MAEDPIQPLSGKKGMAKPVSLLDKFAGAFPPELREAGEKDWLVQPEGCSDTWFAGEVELRGECWFVELEVVDRQLRVSCDCPAGAKGRLCGHVWALLRKAEAFGDLGEARKRSVGASAIVPAATRSAGWKKEMAPPRPARPLPPPRLPAFSIDQLEAVLRRQAGHAGNAAAVRVHALVYPLRGRNAAVRLFWSPPGREPQWDRRHEFDAATSYGSDEEEEFLTVLRPFRRTTGGQVVHELEGGTARVALRRLGLLQRLYLATEEETPIPVRWHDQAAWDFVPTMECQAGRYRIGGCFRGAGQQVDLAEVHILGDGFVLATGHAFEVALGKGARQVRRLFEAGGELWLDAAEAREWALQLRLETDWDLAGFPPGLAPAVREEAFRPQLHVRTAKYKYRGREQLHAELSFHYGGAAVAAGIWLRGISLPRSIVRRPCTCLTAGTTRTRPRRKWGGS